MSGRGAPVGGNAGSLLKRALWDSAMTRRETLIRLYGGCTFPADPEDPASLFAATDGRDDEYDPSDKVVFDAGAALIDDELRNSAVTPIDPEGNVRDELFTHMINGYRVARYLLRRGQNWTSAHDRESHDEDLARLVSYVQNEKHQRATADIVRLASVDDALHYYGYSPTLLRACQEEEHVALGWVRLVQDYGFLLAVAEYELLQSPADRRDVKSAASGGKPPTEIVADGLSKNHNKSEA
ncbi:MAG TPA: hypothetical protein VG476_07215 [Acidimicrobiales bacterium]|nr:hypothetical protein [Acidimicrobiales bacterium]